MPHTSNATTTRRSGCRAWTSVSATTSPAPTRVITAAAATASEMDLAKAMLQELRRVQPNISLAWMAKQLPFRKDEREHFLEGLRRAGLG